MTETIKTNQLTPNRKFFVRGKVVYSRIASKIDGKELIEANIKATQRGQKPNAKPYTRIQISQAEVVPTDPNGYTIEEQYAQSKFFVSRTHQERGQQFSKDNAGHLPKIYVKDLQTGEYNQIENKGELAHGLDVTLMLRPYTTSTNTGVSLDAILVNEPIRYYGSDASAELEKLGIVLNSNPAFDQAPASNQNNVAQTTYAAPQQAQVAQQVMTPNPFTNDVIADQVRQANQVNQVVNPFEQQQPVISNPWEQQPVNTQAGIQPPAQPTLNNQNRGY